MKRSGIVLDARPPEMPFEGFPEAAFKFLDGLKKNNNKAWFEAHRATYEDDLRQPSKRLVGSMGSAFSEAKLPFVSDLKRSLFRINRDIRFSKDKSPYKTHIGIVFPMQGMKEDEWSGMYLGFEPAGKNDVKAYIGGGAYMPSSP
ncbi:MAG: TIGR02453 family protein, partial [Candidatus Kapaibacterium sp.]